MQKSKMMMGKNDISDAIKKMIGDANQYRQRESIFISSSDVDNLRRGLNKASDEIKLFGATIRSSPFIESGTAIIHSKQIHRTRPFASIDVENQIRVESYIRTHFNNFFRNDVLLGVRELSRNERMAGESWIDYIDRCGMGVLDNPITRWEYQKHIWLLVLMTPIKLVKWIWEMRKT